MVRTQVVATETGSELGVLPNLIGSSLPMDNHRGRGQPRLNPLTVRNRIFRGRTTQPA
jgi:hypothetical protein